MYSKLLKKVEEGNKPVHIIVYLENYQVYLLYTHSEQLCFFLASYISVLPHYRS